VEHAETLILDLILRSLSHRRALCGVVLATYRVELTTLLNRVAGTGAQPGDLDRVHDLAERIAATAEAAGLAAVHGDAVALGACTRAASRRRSKKTEGAMLVAGLKVIDRILDTATVEPRPTGTPALN